MKLLRPAAAVLYSGHKMQSKAWPKGSGKDKIEAMSRECPSTTPSLGSLLQCSSNPASASIWEGPGWMDTPATSQPSLPSASSWASSALPITALHYTRASPAVQGRLKPPLCVMGSIWELRAQKGLHLGFP